MRHVHIYSILLILLYCAGCIKYHDGTEVYMQVEHEFEAGNLQKTFLLIDSLKSEYPGAQQVISKADSIMQIAERIYLEFSVNEEDIISELQGRSVDYTNQEKEIWERKNWLEYRIIDGEKKYFNRAASNLKLIKDFHQDRAYRDSLEAHHPWAVFRKEHTQSIIRTSGDQHIPVVPVEMVINYSLTVLPNIVPEGEKVRCWLPWPKEDNIRQQNISFISASDDDYVISPDSLTHRTIYMEAIAQKDEPVVFRSSFSYQASGQYYDPERFTIQPYNKDSELYRKYTSEQLPHINFSEDIRALADNITGQEDNPFEILRRLYYWINENIPWSGAIEYSVMPDIPAYVLRNHRGDCGMQNFLLMSMLRYKGIPVRWQSGWMVPPGNENLHDWCEVYFEGTGWVPVDISYDLQYSSDSRTREFYISGIDSYRLIINDGVSGILYPEKKYLRSEPYDFQRGEVEWSGGNLYFDKWDYEMEIEYKQ